MRALSPVAAVAALAAASLALVAVLAISISSYIQPAPARYSVAAGIELYVYSADSSYIDVRAYAKLHNPLSTPLAAYPRAYIFAGSIAVECQSDPIELAPGESAQVEFTCTIPFSVVSSEYPGMAPGEAASTLIRDAHVVLVDLYGVPS